MAPDDKPDDQLEVPPEDMPGEIRNIPPEQSLITYPSIFPIKVTGLNADGFAQAMAELAALHDPGFDAATIEMRMSSGGKYVGLTLTITATSREQLDALYRALTSHPLVKWVL